MLKTSIIFFSLTSLFAGSAQAKESSFYGIHQNYLSTRAMGMGNAGVAIADDEHALFYNPAGIAQLEKRKFNLFLRAGADPDIQDFAKDIDNAGSDEQAIADVIQANYGEHFSLRGPSLGGIYATKKWAVAFIPADVSVDASLQREVGPAINLNAYQDSTLAFARAWRLRNTRRGQLDLGVTSKLIYRAHLDKVISIAAIQNDKVLEKEDSNEGMTADLDFGALWKLPDYSSGFWHYAQPSFGLVVRNALDYGYFTNLKLYADDKNGKPEKLGRAIDIGSSFQLLDWSVWKTRFAFDVRDVLNDNWNYKKGIHAGLEFLWEMRPWWKGGWRAGINQGYWTAGFTGQIWIFKLDLATYGQEVGTSNKPKEDRVYMFTTSLDF